MKKFTYGSFRIFDHKEMAKFFIDEAECGNKMELANVIPTNIDISEVDLLKLKVELLREGFELDLLESCDGNAAIADKAYSHYLLTITPKLEEFFRILSTETDDRDFKSTAQAEKYRSIVSNITEKVRKAYGEFNVKAELHKEKLNRYKRSIDENRNILDTITKKCEEDVKDYDKKLRDLEKVEQYNLASE